MKNRRIKKRFTWLLILSVFASGLLTGCQPMQPFYLNQNGDCDLSHYLDTATEIEYADVCQEPLEEVSQARAPRTIINPQFEDMVFEDLTLEDAMSMALNNSKVIRTFGQVRQFGQVVGGVPERLSAAPDSVASIYDPALQETSQNGVEQVLSNFDAVFSSSASWDNSDRPQNFQSANSVNSTIFQQDRVTLTNEIQKRSATGTQWFFRNESIYTGSNNSLTAGTRAPGVPSDWFTAFEFEVRQPMLRNRGTQVNRVPIVLARIRTDLSLIDFEQAVAELTNSVEFAYWELFFFYNNLEAAKKGRDSALAAWQKVNALKDNPGGEADKEGRSKEQYYSFRGRVEQAQRDLFKSETKLRYLMGLAPTDHRLFRPADRPTTAQVSYNWSDLLQEGLCRSAGLRRQAWRIKRSEMELLAARNQILPRFDAVALQRWLGVGDEFNSFDNGDSPPFPGIGSTAVDSLWSGNNQEFRIGFEFEVELGARRALTQIRNSELGLARERAKLQDMQLEISHQLTTAVQDLAGGYQSVVTNLNRRAAAQQEVEAVEVAYLAGTESLDRLLEAQSRQSESSIAYYQALVNYNLSIVTMQLRKGSLLDYNGVMLAEGPWPAKAYFDAANRARRRDASHYLDYGFSRPNVISRGAQANRCSQEIQPATYTENPYADIDPNDTYVEADEPTPADKDGKPLTDSLDNAIDSMTDGEGGKAGGRKKLNNDLPDVKKPELPKSDIRDPSRGDLPAPSKKPSRDLDFDDLEAARPRRTAQRSQAPRPRDLDSDLQSDAAQSYRSSVGKRRSSNTAQNKSSNSVQIKWKD